MSIVTDMIRDGDRLFRWRSYLPLVLVPVLMAAVLEEGSPFAGSVWARAWQVLAVAVSFSGLLMRVVAVATAPSGTSERGTRHPRAAVLRTTGFYSVVRHPLYVANVVMVLGLALFPAIWYLPLIAVLSSLLYYERIAAREEAFLEERFGEEFRAWAARVPAMVPSWRGFRASDTPAAWKKPLRYEFHGLLVIASGVFLLDLAQRSRAAHQLVVDPVWGAMFAVSAAIFIVMAILKRGTRLLDIVEGHTPAPPSTWPAGRVGPTS